MSNIIYKQFYTYQIIDGDLTIYTWSFLEDWGNEVAYINHATNRVTYVTPYQDPTKFEKENGVWLDQISLVAEVNGEDDITFEFDEFSDEGRAWFESLEGDKAYLDEIDEFYQIDGDEEVEQYYKQTMDKKDEGDE